MFIFVLRVNTFLFLELYPIAFHRAYLSCILNNNVWDSLYLHEYVIQLDFNFSYYD